MNRLTVSVDGLKAETFEAVRPGASFEKVTDNLRELSRQVEAGGHDLALGVAFTIQEVNAGELALLGSLADPCRCEDSSSEASQRRFHRRGLESQFSQVPPLTGPKPNGNLLTMAWKPPFHEVLEAG